MKTELAAMIGCLGLFLGSCAFACGDGGCGFQSSCGSQAVCGCSESVNTCQCTDPQCFSGNPCLSQGTCCEAFGNIGATDEY